MTTQWQINPGVQRVELQDGQAEVKFDVRNPGPVDDRATVDVVGSEQTDASWFTVPEPQRTVPHGGSVTFVAVLKPGEKAPPGTHWFAGRVYSADTAPEENSVTSDRVQFEIKPPADKPKPKWWLWALIGGGLVVVVLGVVLFLLLSGGPEVPLVEGMTEAEATALIEDAGLVAVVEKQGHATVDAGRVISQEPRAGSAAEDGAKVTIKVSTGPTFVNIPIIAGHFDAFQGVLELQNAGLDVKVVLRASKTVPRDEVIGTDPPAQRKVLEGSEVKLLVSSGPFRIPPNKADICVKNPVVCDLVKKTP